MPVRKQVDKPLDKLSIRLKKYAEILSEGTHSMMQAAILAGFSPTVGDRQAFKWIGRTEETSQYPALFHYYTELYKKNQRLFEATKQNVIKELALLAYSDITRFVDLPSKTYEDKQMRAQLIEQACNAVHVYGQWQKDIKTWQDRTSKKKGSAPDEPKRPTYKQMNIVEEFQLMEDEERLNVMFWRDYRKGSITVKNREDIPKELLPQIAEIAHTRDGIRIKLHSKTDALDKLARILKMYDEDKSEGDKYTNIQNINLIVNGSKSNLLSQDISSPPVD